MCITYMLWKILISWCNIVGWLLLPIAGSCEVTMLSWYQCCYSVWKKFSSCRIIWFCGFLAVIAAPWWRENKMLHFTRVDPALTLHLWVEIRSVLHAALHAIVSWSSTAQTLSNNVVFDFLALPVYTKESVQADAAVHLLALFTISVFARPSTRHSIEDLILR